MGRRPIAALVLTALATTLMTFAPPAASANSSFESQFVSKINAERAKRGLGSLSVKSDLVASGRRHSARMEAKGTIWHNPNLGSEIKGWRTLGENVGMGPTVESLHQAFMDSDGHRRNILLPEFDEVGIGVVVADNGLIFVTQVFVQRGAWDTYTPSSGSSSSGSTSAPSVAAQGSVTPVAAPEPKPLPKPKPRTVTQLVRLMDLDR